MEIPVVDPQPCRGKFNEKLWVNNNYWAEQKFHGCRYLLYSDGRMLSRHSSVKGTGYVDKSDRVPHLRSSGLSLPEGTVLDGELVTHPFCKVQDVTSIIGSLPEIAIEKQKNVGKLKLLVFDMPFYCGKDWRSEPLYARREALAWHFGKHHLPGIQLVNVIERLKQDYYKEIMLLGGEGVILKDKFSRYGEKSKWIKVKRSETFDVFVIGYKPAKEMSIKVDGTTSMTRYAERGWIGAVEMGMVSNNPHYMSGEVISVGFCSGFDEETREFITEHQETLLGRVMEIEAQSQYPTGSFEHPRFVRWREDKHKDECIWEG